MNIRMTSKLTEFHKKCKQYNISHAEFNVTNGDQYGTYWV